MHSSLNKEWELFENWVGKTPSEIILVSGNHDIISPHKFEALGILEFENLTTDGDIDWSALERPLDTDEAQSHEQSMLAQFHERHGDEIEELKSGDADIQQQVAQDQGSPQAGGCC